MSTEAIVKKSFEFAWKSQMHPMLGDLALQHNRGNIVDLGCGTCQLYVYLKERGWRGEYIGIDLYAYEDATYPHGVTLIFGDAATLTLPQSDTYVLYDVLEHVDDPVGLLSKCLQVSQNVLVAVPKRNEELWQYGIVEYHQLDKTHKHCGFAPEELYNVVEKSGGRILGYQELIETNPLNVLRAFYESEGLYRWMRRLLKLFPFKVYHQEMWCELELR